MQSPVHSCFALVTVWALSAAPTASGQRAGILRPSRVADSARTVSVQPALAGFRIGEPAAGAITRLGAPLRVDTLGSGPDAPLSFANLATGITLIVSRDEGVGIILLTSRQAGALDSIRVGDARGSVLARWGPPVAGSKAAGLWFAGAYVITVAFDGSQRVTRLGIGVGY